MNWELVDTFSSKEDAEIAEQGFNRTEYETEIVPAGPLNPGYWLLKKRKKNEPHRRGTAADD